MILKVRCQAKVKSVFRISPCMDTRNSIADFLGTSCMKYKSTFSNYLSFSAFSQGLI